MNEEDEAFEAIEQAQGWRKRQIANAIQARDDDTMCYRNDLLEEVARNLEHNFIKAFGPDTISSFATYKIGRAHV